MIAGSRCEGTCLILSVYTSPGTKCLPRVTRFPDQYSPILPRTRRESGSPGRLLGHGLGCNRDSKCTEDERSQIPSPRLSGCICQIGHYGQVLMTTHRHLASLNIPSVLAESRSPFLGRGTLCDGTEAVGAFAANPIDLALLDYHMPQMNGDLAAGHMTTCKADVPVALMSADNLPLLANLKAVDAFVCKSEGICRILDIVDDLLSRRICLSRSKRGGKLPSVQPERELRSSNCKLQLHFKHKIRAHRSQDL
jgi:CheY-like chemotaxis protein